MHDGRQEKYKGKTFEEKLETSQGLVTALAAHLTKKGVLNRAYDDSNPWTLPNGEKLRGLDILGAKGGAAIWIDAKDFGALYAIRGHKPGGITGLPKKLVERYRYIERETGIKVAIFWRDSSDKMNWESSPFYDAEREVFEPYGGFMSDLDELQGEDLVKIPTKFGGGGEQVFWRVSREPEDPVMETFTDFVDKLIAEDEAKVEEAV